MESFNSPIVCHDKKDTNENFISTNLFPKHVFIIKEGDTNGDFNKTKDQNDCIAEENSLSDDVTKEKKLVDDVKDEKIRVARLTFYINIRHRFVIFGCDQRNFECES